MPDYSELQKQLEQSRFQGVLPAGSPMPKKKIITPNLPDFAQDPNLLPPMPVPSQVRETDLTPPEPVAPPQKEVAGPELDSPENTPERAPAAVLDRLMEQREQYRALQKPEVTNESMKDPETFSTVQQLRSLAASQVKRQKEHLVKLQSQLENYKNDSGGFFQNVNLGPAASWIDFLNDNKSNVYKAWKETSGYSTPAQKKAMKLKVENALYAAEDKLTTQQMKLLSERLKGDRATATNKTLLRIYGKEGQLNKDERDYLANRNDKVTELHKKNVQTYGKGDDAYTYMEGIKLVGEMLRPYKAKDAKGNTVLKMSPKKLKFIATRLAKVLGKDAGNIAVQESSRYDFNTLDSMITAAKAFFKENPDEEALPAEFGNSLRELLDSSVDSFSDDRIRASKSTRATIRNRSDMDDPRIQEFAEKEHIRMSGEFQEFKDRARWEPLERKPVPKGFDKTGKKYIGSPKKKPPRTYKGGDALMKKLDESTKRLEKLLGN